MSEHDAVSQEAVYSTNQLLKKATSARAEIFSNFGGLRAKGWYKEISGGLPVVSIITIVKNDVNHIERTMLSVLNQTYKNVEYIIIDGGSTDGTLEIIKKYEQYIDLWVSEPDGGINFAVNKGIDAVTGAWVNFMSSGDFFCSTHVVESMLAQAANADILYGDFLTEINGQKTLCKAFDDIKTKAWQGMRVCFETLFIKAEVLKKHKFNVNFRVSGDGDFVARCIVDGHVFKKCNVAVFEVGTLGYSNKHWLRGRIENWLIARKYFSKIRADLFHLWGLVYFVTFQTLKKILSSIGLYSFLKNLYRKWYGEKLSRKKYNYYKVKDSDSKV